MSKIEPCRRSISWYSYGTSSTKKEMVGREGARPETSGLDDHSSPDGKTVSDDCRAN